jgi:hypothetical protein
MKGKKCAGTKKAEKESKNSTVHGGGEEKETETATVWSPFKRESSFRLDMMLWMHVHGCSPLDALHSWVYTDGGSFELISNLKRCECLT